MTVKRFKYYISSQTLEDRLTGRRYFGNKQLVDLLNELCDENEDLKKRLEVLIMTKKNRMILNNDIIQVDLRSDNIELLNDIINEINVLLKEHYP